MDKGTSFASFSAHPPSEVQALYFKYNYYDLKFFFFLCLSCNLKTSEKLYLENWILLSVIDSEGSWVGIGRFGEQWLGLKSQKNSSF